jgi:glycerol-3-phosphate O-acyltransferase
MIQFLLSSDLVSELKDARETVYVYDEKKRRALDFYKNNIIHFLVVPSILAQALQRPTTRAELLRDLFWWVQLFRYEFFLPDERAVRTRAEVYLGHFIAEKLVKETAEGLQPNPEGLTRLALHSGVLASFREGYFAVLESVSHIKEWPIPEKKLLSEIDLTFKKYFLLKEVRRPESRNPVVFRNALRSLVTHEHLVLRHVSVGKGKSSTLYDRGSAFEGLVEVRRILARSLESHDS